jgi:hypothetical protein
MLRLRLLRRGGLGRNTAAAFASDATGTVDPFAIVSDELDAVSARMRAAVVSEARTEQAGDVALGG